MEYLPPTKHFSWQVTCCVFYALSLVIPMLKVTIVLFTVPGNTVLTKDSCILSLQRMMEQIGTEKEGKKTKHRLVRLGPIQALLMQRILGKV